MKELFDSVLGFLGSIIYLIFGYCFYLLMIYLLIGIPVLMIRDMLK